MKKLLFLAVLISLAGAVCGQERPYTYIAQRNEWLAGMFTALGLPRGDSAQFQPGQRTRQGAVYMDTVNTPASPNGYYIYEDPTGGNNPYWNLQKSPGAIICGNRLLTPWNVSWQGTGFNFTVHGGQPTGQGSYQIGCSFYTADSLTVTLDPADATLERIDIIYLDATGVHVRAGDLAAVGTAQKPSVTLDEIELTFITVSPLATEPTLTTLMVYDENTESNVTNIGTTTNADNLTHVYHGVKAIEVTNVNHNDMVNMTRVLSGTWNVLGMDGLTLAIELKPTFPTSTAANIGVSLIVGTTTVGTEVLVPMVKTNNSTYQLITIPLSAFGNLANTNITTVRVRYSFPTAPLTVYAGFYLDYVYFVDGLSQPPSNTTPAQFTLNMPPGFTVNPTNTQQEGGGWTVTNQTATAGQYYTKEGWVTLPSFMQSIGTLDGQAKSADGASVNAGQLFMQLADNTYPGLLSPELHAKISQNDSITNGTPGDTLLVKVDDSTLLVKSLIAGTNVSFDVGADSIVINATGGSSLTAGEGTAISGDSIHLGGLIGTPATAFSQWRTINTNRKGLIIHNGDISDLVDPGGISWGFGQEVFSPLQILSRDTVTANDVDPPTAAVPWSGVYARRQLYYPTGTLRTQKVFGHQFEMDWQFDDTLSLNTQSGDYNTGFSIKNIYDPYGTGRQGIRASHGTNQNNSIAYAAPGLLVTNVLRNGNTAGNWIKVDGHLSGINSYVVMGSVLADTIKAYVYYTTGGFISATSLIQRSYDFAPASYFASPRIDSAFGWFDTARVKYQYFAGKSVYGPSRGSIHPWTSSDQLKVIGNVNITDSLVLGKASLIGDSTGYDWVIRRRTDGSLFRIRADLMASFFGSGVTTIGSFNTTSTANGLDISGSTLTAHAASASNPGMVIVGSGLSINGSGVLSATAPATPGIDDVLAVAQSLTTNRTLNIATSNLTIGSTAGDVFKFNSDRSVRLPGYGSGTFTGTPAKYPAFDASGNLIEMNFLPMTLQDVLNNDNIALNTNILMNGSAQLIFDWRASTHGITFASGPTFLGSTNTYLQTSVTEDSSFSFVPAAGSGTYTLDGGYITADRHIRFPDASGTIALTSDIPAPSGSGTVNTGTANTLAYYPASTAAVDDLTPITANRALISDANGLPTHSATTATELGYVSGVSSAIQTQLDAKANTALSNLASVAVNTTIASDADNTDDLGTSAKAWKDIYTRTTKYNGSTSGTVTVEAQATGITPLVTTSTGQGYGSSCMEAREPVGTDFTGQNINTVQPMFAAAHDVWPLAASTSYDFEGMLSLNHGATSHSVGLSFELSGGASVTSITYITICWVTAIGTNTASQTTNFIQATTNTSVNAAGANATEQIYFKGTINMNAAGNVTPSYTFSAQPTGTCVTKGGSYIKFCPKGTNTFTTQGPAN